LYICAAEDIIHHINQTKIMKKVIPLTELSIEELDKKKQIIQGTLLGLGW